MSFCDDAYLSPSNPSKREDYTKIIQATCEHFLNVVTSQHAIDLSGFISMLDDESITVFTGNTSELGQIAISGRSTSILGNKQ